MKRTPTQDKTAVVLVFSRVAQLFGAYSPRGWGCPNPVRETRPFLRCHFILKLIFLPRQARNKHRETTQNKDAFPAGGGETQGGPYRSKDLRKWTKSPFAPLTQVRNTAFLLSSAL